jgi:pimeloyl-ACP methyl ester carboxylesterase
MNNQAWAPNRIPLQPLSPRGLLCALRMLRPLQAVALTLLLLGLSIGVSPAQTSPAKARSHVYLLRGVLNVFSLGMDEIAAKLERQGISTTVANYLSWPSLANEAAAEYKSGRVRNIILVGHSSGATAVTEMAARLGQLGVPVKLAIGLDPTSRETASGNVGRYINYYIANGLGTPVIRGRQFNGVLENVDVEKNPELGHFNIDKNRALQERVIREIRAAL